MRTNPITEASYKLFAATLTLGFALLTVAPTEGAETLFVSIQASGTDQGSNAIERFTLTGVGSIFANTTSINPRGVAFDSAGNLYVASAIWNTIEKFTPDGVGSTFANTGLDGPFGLTFDRADNLYVANWTGNTVVKFTPNGVGSVFASTGLNNPFGMAIDSQGNLFVSNWGDSTVQKFTPDGVGSVFASLPTSVRVTGLALDKADNLYVLVGTAIQKYMPGGVHSVFVKSTALLATPFGLAVDSAGNVYAANQGSNTVVKFTPDGVGSVFASTERSVPEFIAIRTVLPSIVVNDGMLGVGSNGFGFNMTAVPGEVVVVEASANLDSPNWLPVQTNTIGAEPFYFSDSAWTNYPKRFYRVRSQ